MLTVWNLSESRIDEELLARGSRISGTREQKQDRLQRFLDFENQKERRNQAVRQARADREEMDGQKDGVDDDEKELECYDDCARNHEEKERVAEALVNLRQHDWVERNVRILLETVNELDECLETSVAENLRLNQRINNLEMRLSHLENRSDSPPPLIFPESNPNWRLDTAFTTYTSSPAL